MVLRLLQVLQHPRVERVNKSDDNSSVSADFFANGSHIMAGVSPVWLEFWQIQLRSPDARVWGGTHPGLNLGAKLWISLKCSSNANISWITPNRIFALELDLKVIHSFTPRFNPGCVPSQTRASGDLNWILKWLASLPPFNTNQHYPRIILKVKLR